MVRESIAILLLLSLISITLVGTVIYILMFHYSKKDTKQIKFKGFKVNRKINHFNSTILTNNTTNTTNATNATNSTN